MAKPKATDADAQHDSAPPSHERSGRGPSMRRKVLHAGKRSLAQWPIAGLFALLATALSAWACLQSGELHYDRFAVRVSRTSDAVWHARLTWDTSLCTRVLHTNDVWYVTPYSQDPLEGLLIGGVHSMGNEIALDDGIEAFLPVEEATRGGASPRPISEPFSEPLTPSDQLEMSLSGTDAYGVPFRMLASRYTN